MVTHAGGDAEEPIRNYIDGPYWRVYGDSYVEGIAYDIYGNVMSDANIDHFYHVAYQIMLNDF